MNTDFDNLEQAFQIALGHKTAKFLKKNFKFIGVEIINGKALSNEYALTEEYYKGIYVGIEDMKGIRRMFSVRKDYINKLMEAKDDKQYTNNKF